MKIVLMGYMASGKSTVGKLLASRLGLPFLDLDDHIESVEKKSIKELFAEKGEIYFRKLESRMLSQVLEGKASLVLATGGGTPIYGNNMETILDHADHSVYLQLSLPELVSRISQEKDTRPLVRDLAREDLPEFIGKHLFERIPVYSRANYVLDCNGKEAQAVARELEELLL